MHGETVKKSLNLFTLVRQEETRLIIRSELKILVTGNHCIT